MREDIVKIYGGKWWKTDFHVHTPASDDYGKGSANPESEKKITPKDFLLNAMEKKIDCLIVSDHNTFKWIPELRTELKKMQDENDIDYRKIYLFPAVELNVNGNIHILGIFDVEADYEMLAGILGKVEYMESCKATNKSLAEVIEIIVKNGGIAIPAHVDGSSGMFYEDLCSASTIKSALEVDGILALEMTGKELNHQLYLENKRKFSYVIGSDSHCLDTVGKSYTWVKMGTPNIEALRLALFDEEDGVRRNEYFDGNPNEINERMYIKYIEIREAKYAGRRKPLRIEFSPWMTSIIGGRGTGKSSVIQFLRMVLEKNNDLPEELKKEFEDFITIPKNRNDLGMLREETLIDVCVARKEWIIF